EHGAPPVDQTDPEASSAARAWLKLFGAGDAAKLAARARVPFVIGDQVVARTREELQGVLQGMLDESGGGAPGAAEMFTAAGLRKRFGSVPAGVQEGLGRNYAVTKIRGEQLVLILERRFGDWRVVGVARRRAGPRGSHNLSDMAGTPPAERRSQAYTGPSFAGSRVRSAVRYTIDTFDSADYLRKF